MLKSRCFEKNNIQKLKTKSLLRELAPNINISSTDVPLKDYRLLRKKNMQ